MTDTDLNARLARMESDVAHTKRVVDRIEANERDVVQRLVRLETGDKRMDGLPDRVAHAESVNDVQEAVKAERAHMSREIRAFVLGGFTIAGVVFAIASYVLGNGS
jgi:hypothetical protein